MSFFNTLLGVPLGYLMYLCYQLARNYGLAVILFTLLTKILLFPLSLSSQKNAVTLVRIRPALEDIRLRHAGNSPALMEEQKALYKEEGYSTLKGLLPLLVQIPVILGLIQVIYNPLQHLLHLDQGTIALLLDRTASLLNKPLADLGAGGQLKILEMVQANPEAYLDLKGIEAILGMDTAFLGVNLTHTPSLGSVTLLYPLLSGLSALALALYQNSYYVLQRGQGPVKKAVMAAFLVAFSGFFAYLLPTGVGLYWIAGNLLSIPVLAASNLIHDPKKHGGHVETGHKTRPDRGEKAKIRQLEKDKRQRQKLDRRRFAARPDKRLVFYSEGSGYYKYFEGFIHYILEHSDLVVHYVTSDFDDRVFKRDLPRLESYYIGPVALIRFMMTLDATMVVMTTPDLENYHIKRSLVRKDVEYVYLDHGMTSFHLMLKKGALDHFDTIFCYGPNHMDEIRQTEELYDLPPKRLVKTGYPLLDSMIGQVRQLGDRVNNPRVILIAPSWQKDSILDYCLDETLAPLLRTGYRVILRPHPEYVKRFPAKIEAIRDKYRDRLGPFFELQVDFSSSETVYTADLVITDWSSIAQEFSYATGKPSLFINTPMKIMNPEYDRIASPPLDISLRQEIGLSVDPDQLADLPALVERLFDERDLYAGRIARIVSDNIYDLGEGARGGGAYIVGRLTEAEKNQEARLREDQGLPALLEKQLRAVTATLPLDGEGLAALLNDPLTPSDLESTRGEFLLRLLEEMEGLPRKEEKDS